MTGVEKPAHGIAVPASTLRLLGEVVVILGQIDEDMTRSLTGLLSVDRPTANRLMRTPDAIDLWAGVMKGRLDHQHFDPAVLLAASETKGVHKDRNDFIHADYRPAFKLEGQWVTVRGYSSDDGQEWAGKVIATRSRDQRRRGVEEIAALRDRAARTSRLVAHLTFAVAPHGSWVTSPWLSSVEPFMAKSAKRSAGETADPRFFIEMDNVRPVPLRNSNESGDHDPEDPK